MILVSSERGALTCRSRAHHCGGVVGEISAPKIRQYNNGMGIPI